jgi:hypothetical protein
LQTVVTDNIPRVTVDTTASQKRRGPRPKNLAPTLTDLSGMTSVVVTTDGQLHDENAVAVSGIPGKQSRSNDKIDFMIFFSLKKVFYKLKVGRKFW